MEKIDYKYFVLFVHFTVVTRIFSIALISLDFKVNIVLKIKFIIYIFQVVHVSSTFQ